MSAAQSASGDTISGTVRLPTGASANAAEIAVTPAGSTQSFTTHSDSSGGFRIVVPQSAKYVIFARAADGSTGRVTVDRSTTGNTTIFLTLNAAQVLPRVSVQSRRAPTDSRLAPAFGQSESELAIVSGDASPSEQGKIGSALDLIVGALASSKGSSFNVLGLSSDQNRITFNGTPVQSLELPRSTPVIARLNSSPHDVSKGGFSGALLTVEPRPAWNFITTNVGVSGQPRVLAGKEGPAALIGDEESAVHVDFAHTGPIKWDKSAYTVSGQIGKRIRPVASLSSLPSSALSELGISESAVARLTEQFKTAGLPYAFEIDSRTTSTNEGSFLGRLDFTPAKSRRTSFTGTGSFSDVDFLGVGPTSSATGAFTSRSWNQTVQADDQRTARNAVLNDFHLGYSGAMSRQTPSLNIPAAIVMLPNDNSSNVTVPVFFGGAGTGRSADRRTTIDVSNTSQWYSRNGEHLFKASVQAQYDRIQNNVGATTYGQYLFLSPEKVASNEAATFARTLGRSLARGDFTSIAGSVGDTWEREKGFSFQYGIRLDVFRANPDFADASSNTHQSLIPSFDAKWTAAVSPRIGFTRTYVLPQPNTATPARRIIVSGGTGIFQSADAQAVLAPLRRTGWRSDLGVQLFCVADAVPQPDWRAFVESPQLVPVHCAGAPSAANDSAITVARLASDFRPPMSWRTNLAATTRVWRVRLGADGILSFNRFQSDIRDVNLAGKTKFRLENEGNRPVFVDAAAINGTGFFSVSGNRLDPTFGPVWIVGSGLKSLSRQLVLSIQSSNPTILVRRSWQISYGQSWVTEQRRGFEGSTVDNPSTINRLPGQFESRHQLAARGSWVFGSSDQLEISGYLRLNSGFPFTPLIASDINGDGLANDRPWIFASATNSVTAKDIEKLAESGPGYVKDCLMKQRGGFAGAQSCTGPWSVSSTVNFKMRGDVVRMPSRSRVTLSVTNPMILADRLLHGSDVKGWGQLPVVDPYLYSVTGFDATARKFQYSVNPGFGSRLSSRSITTNPFRLSLSVFIPVGPTWGAQSVENDLAPGRWRKGSRKNADEMTNEHILGVIGFDPVSRIGQGRDSASYTPAQRVAIRSAISIRDSALRAIFSRVAVVAAEVSANPSQKEKREVLRQRAAATDSAIAVMITAGETITSILTAEQLEKLSPGTRIFLNRPDILYLRRLQGFVY